MFNFFCVERAIRVHASINLQALLGFVVAGIWNGFKLTISRCVQQPCSVTVRARTRILVNVLFFRFLEHSFNVVVWLTRS